MSLQSPFEGLTDYRPPYRTQIVQSLADFRREWQKTLEGKSLLDVQAPIGLILADIADRLQLNAQERHVILGGKLINEVNCVREEHITVKLPS